MQFGPLRITAPFLEDFGHSEAEVFGSITWLWMHTSEHRDLPLKALSSLVLPPIKAGQYILASAQFGEDIRPVAYMAWANLSATAESRYLHHPAKGLRPDDWRSGDRMWITDWFTPFGHGQVFRRAVCELLPTSTARALHHRGNERGMRVRTFDGRQVSREQAQQWWQTRPMLAYAQSDWVGLRAPADWLP